MPFGPDRLDIVQESQSDQFGMDRKSAVPRTALLARHFAIAPAGQIVANVEMRDSVVESDVGDLKPRSLLTAAMMVEP